MKILCLLPFLLWTAVVHGKVMVLKAERDLSTGIEQVALTFHPDKIIMTRNSNFMDGPSSSTQIGLFYGDYNDSAKNHYKLLLNIAARLKGQTKGLQNAAGIVGEEDYQSPHRIVISLDRNEIHQDSIYYQAMFELLANSLDLITWNADEAVRVQEKNGKVSIEKVGSQKGASVLSQKNACRLVNSKLHYCPVEKFGGVYLRSQ